MRMKRPVTWGLVGWLLAAAAGQIAAFEVVRRVFVTSRRGQLLDTAALTGNSIGQRHIDSLVDYVLSAMTVLSLAAAILVIGFIALMRRRALLAAAATLLIVGANVTTQLLKYGIERPELGIDMARAGAGNSLPSGHTTVAASVAVALVLVLPAQVRGLAALVGAGYAALAGVATLSAGWHRPSDAVAAMLVVGVWAAIAGLLLATANHRDRARAAPATPHRVALVTLFVAGSALLTVAAAAMAMTDQVPLEWLSRRRLFAAYAGGAAGIAGTAGMVMAIVLATVHLVVPPRAPDLITGRLGRPAARAAAVPAAPAARR